MKTKVEFIKSEDTYTVEHKNSIYNVYVGKDNSDGWWLEIMGEDGDEPDDDIFEDIRMEFVKRDIIPN